MVTMAHQAHLFCNFLRRVPADLRPGAPEAQQQAAGDVNQQLGQQHRRRRRGPGRQARDAARRDAWRKRRQEAQLPLPVLQPLPPPPPPPPPAAPPRRLVTIVKEKTSRSTFSQLDGEEEEPVTTPGGPPSPTNQVEFQCDKCDDAFNREINLAKHKSDVHNDWRLFTSLYWDRTRNQMRVAIQSGCVTKILALQRWSKNDFHQSFRLVRSTAFQLTLWGRFGRQRPFSPKTSPQAKRHQHDFFSLFLTSLNFIT